MNLQGEDIDSLKDTIVNDAYKEQELKQVLQKKLEFNYDANAEGDNYSDRVFNLINYFKRQGKKPFLNLIQALCQDRTKNERLQKIGQQINKSLVNVTDNDIPKIPKKHFEDVAKSLKDGNLIFFLGSGINFKADYQLPPSNREIADSLNNIEKSLNTKKLMGFPCEICPFKVKQKGNKNETIFKPESCPVVKEMEKKPQLMDEQRLREAKLELRCRAQYWKDIYLLNLPPEMRISQKLNSQDILQSKISNILRDTYKDYQYNPLQKCLADLIETIKTNKNKDPKWENSYQLIATTTYDWGLELAFEANQQDIDVISYMAHGKDRGKFNYTHYHIREQTNQTQDLLYQDELIPDLLNKDNKDKIVSSLKWRKLRKNVGLERPIILKLYGGVIYNLKRSKDNQVEQIKDSFFIPEIYHINYLRNNQNEQLNVRQLLPDKLIRHWDNSKILFIGFSANDPDLRAILDCFRSSQETSSHSQESVESQETEAKTSDSQESVKGWLIHQSDYPGDLNETMYWKNHWGIELQKCSFGSCSYIEELKKAIDQL